MTRKVIKEINGWQIVKFVGTRGCYAANNSRNEFIPCRTIKAAEELIDHMTNR